MAGGLYRHRLTRLEQDVRIDTARHDPNGLDFVSITGTSNGVPNPNEKEPKLDEFSLAVERQLGQTFAVRVTGVYSNTFNIYKIANNLAERRLPRGRQHVRMVGQGLRRVFLPEGGP